MNNGYEHDSPSEGACARPRRHSSTASDRHSRVRDIGLGVTCGLAAVGIAAGAWIGALRGHGNVGDAFAASGGASWGADESANAKTITINVTTFGSLRSVIGGAATRVTMPEGSTVADLSQHLADIYPELAPAAMLAVDDSSEMMPLDKVLTDAQTVELIGSTAGG